MITDGSKDLNHFRFRGLHPKISMGTASDRYAGWVGQIYTKERYQGRITQRTDRVGGKPFAMEVLPVDSVKEYFEHFSVLEIDYTFYRPLLDKEGKPTQNYHVLCKYRQYLGSNDRVILKVPQAISAQRVRRKGEYVENEAYLNPETFARQFYEPAVEILGSILGGLIFEQEYQRKKDRRPVNRLAAELDGFFNAIPKDERYHLELRTEKYLSKRVFEVMEKHGVGQVLSHWTWLPPLRKQFAKAGRRIFNVGKQSIVRLMTPIGMRYEDAFAKAYPFDKLVDEMFRHEMVEETADLMRQGVVASVQTNVIINNRSGGNAPMIAQRVAERFLLLGSGLHS